MEESWQGENALKLKWAFGRLHNTLSDLVALTEDVAEAVHDLADPVNKVETEA